MPVYRIYEATTPFNASELPDMDYEQTADVIYIAHQNHPPNKVIRHSHTDWEFADVLFGPTLAPPTGVVGTATVANTDAANGGNAYFPQYAYYQVTAVNEETGQESRVSAAVSCINDLGLKRNYNTITWSAVIGANLYRIYKSDNFQSFGNIGTTDTISFVDDNIDPDLSVGPPVGDDPFAVPGDRPSTITFHEQRSWWGRSANRPNALWASRSADYENMDFSRPGREDDSLIIGLVANKVNSVNNLVSTQQGLLALTSNNIFAVQGSNEDYITATPPPRVRPKISRGASRLKPILIDNVVFYETAKSGEVRTIGYDFELDGLKTDDVSIFSRHLFEGRTIVSWCFAEKPNSCFYVILDDGIALCLTWDQAQQVWGWTTLETDGLFLQTCSITEQGEDRVYFLIQRTINGVAKYYVERLASALWQTQEEACFLDCARSYVNTVPVATYDRLDHLEGREVVAWVDGSKVSLDANGDPLTVTGGKIVLPNGGISVTIGLPFTAEVQTLPLAMQTGQGWTIARPQDAERAILKVIDSRGIKAGVSEDQLFEIKQREFEAYGEPTELFTGNLDVSLGGTSGDETTIFIRSEDPTPLHLAAVLIEPNFGNMS